MAGKGWMTQVAAACGVAAGTGAAQLGLGYGLGVVVWPATPTPDDSVWLGSLGWATWIAASATVFGAVIAARLRGAPAPRLAGPWRFALAASAAVGALLTVALIAVPARSAVRADTFAPEMIAGGYAVIGIALGLVIAYWAVVSRAVAANLIATAGYLWALAAAGIVVELTLHRESATYLTSWQFAELGTPARYGTIYWPSALLTLLAALIVGMIAAWPSVRSGDLGVGAACSGAVGPVLVAASFLVLAPQLTGALGQLESAYLIAPYAVLAGLAGSALVVASGQRSAQRRAARIHRPSPPAATGKATVPAQAGTNQAAANQAAANQAAANQAGAPRRAGRQIAKTARTSTATDAQASPSEESARRTGKPGKAPAETANLKPGRVADGQEDQPSRWSRLRRGGRSKPSAATGRAEVTTEEPAPTRAPAPASANAESAKAESAHTPSAHTPSADTAPARAAAPAGPPSPGRPAARATGPAPAAGEAAGPADRAGTKSTVAAPPPAPPIAKINPPRLTEAEPQPKPDRPASRTTPAKAAPSQEAPPAKATRAKAQPTTEPDKST